TGDSASVALPGLRPCACGRSASDAGIGLIGGQLGGNRIHLGGARGDAADRSAGFHLGLFVLYRARARVTVAGCEEYCDAAYFSERSAGRLFRANERFRAVE